MKYEENVDLKKYNTYHIGGIAKYLYKPNNIIELKELLEKLHKDNTKYYILGGGSNVILPDEDFDGAIIKLDKLNEFKIDGNFVYAGSGLLLNEFIKKTLDNGYVNFDSLFGIPGSLGGAIIGNAGANNKCIFDELISVLILDNGYTKLISKENIKYEYRNTSLKNSHKIILGAVFKLEKGNVKESWDNIKINLEKRRNSQPLEYPSAGSVFKNPDKTSAGKLIDECGLKGTKKGGARISDKHANFIINENNAKSSDIIYLIDLIKKEIKKEKKIDLELEQIIVKW